MVVVSKANYERLPAPPLLVEFLRQSPLAQAVADGAFGDPATAELFPRPADPARAVAFD